MNLRRLKVGQYGIDFMVTVSIDMKDKQKLLKILNEQGIYSRATKVEVEDIGDVVFIRIDSNLITMQDFMYHLTN